MRWLRTAARLAVVAFPPRQHLLHRLGHRQRRIEVLVLDDRRLVDLPDLVEHPVGQDIAPMADLEQAIRIIAHLDPRAHPRTSVIGRIEMDHYLLDVQRPRVRYHTLTAPDT